MISQENNKTKEIHISVIDNIGFFCLSAISMYLSCAYTNFSPLFMISLISLTTLLVISIGNKCFTIKMSFILIITTFILSLIFCYFMPPLVRGCGNGCAITIESQYKVPYFRE